MLVIRAARLFDGQSHTVLDNPVVLVEDGKILAVSSGGEDPAETQVIDLGEVTLLPGLIDTHVHLGFDATPNAVATMIAEDDDALLVRMAANAQQAMAAGITTVRDLGDRGYLALILRERFRAGGEIGPDIVVAGPPITVTDGHCHFMGGVADTPGEIRAAIGERVERGTDVVKLMVTGGGMTRGTNMAAAQYSLDAVVAAAREAHEHGLPITGHAHGTPGIAHAVDAGLDGIEHCTFWSGQGIEPDLALIERMASAGTAVCRAPFGKIRDAPQPLPRLLARRAESIALVGLLHRAGVNLIAGTDAGVPNRPHDSLAFTIAALAEAGLGNVNALLAATSRAAVACGLADRKGTLGPGMDADILAVAGNPIENIEALHNVEAVFKGGVCVRRLSSR